MPVFSLKPSLYLTDTSWKVIHETQSHRTWVSWSTCVGSLHLLPVTLSSSSWSTQCSRYPLYHPYFWKPYLSCQLFQDFQWVDQSTWLTGKIPPYNPPRREGKIGRTWRSSLTQARQIALLGGKARERNTTLSHQNKFYSTRGEDGVKPSSITSGKRKHQAQK